MFDWEDAFSHECHCQLNSSKGVILGPEINQLNYIIALYIYTLWIGQRSYIASLMVG